MNVEAKQDPKQHDKALELTIRATNGENWPSGEFRANTKVSHVIKKAVDHFVALKVMTEGDYRLALVVGGTAQPPLPDGDTLGEAGVPDHATLVLVPRDPQVDG
jgi:hypothetical protein